MSAWSQGDESSETTRNTLDKNSSSNDLSGHVSSATMDYGCTEEALDESKRENKKRFRNINNNKNNNNNNNRSNQSVGETTTNSSSSSSPSSNLEEQSVMHTTQITSSN